MSVPFYDGYKKYTEIAVGHKDLISAIASAYGTDYCPGIIQKLFSLTHSAYKKHRIPPNGANSNILIGVAFD